MHKSLLLAIIGLVGSGFQLAENGFRVSRVPKSDQVYIECKLVENVQSADVVTISNFFLSKEGFFMCDINETTDCIKLKTLSRVTTDNVTQILNHLGYHVDTAWGNQETLENK